MMASPLVRTMCARHEFAIWCSCHALMTEDDARTGPMLSPAARWWNGLSAAEQEKHLAPLAPIRAAMIAEGSPEALATLTFHERVRILHAYMWARSRVLAPTTH